MSSTTWNGPAVFKETIDAARAALDDTTAACVATVRSARTGRAAGVEAEAAVVAGDQIRARWGMFPPPHGGAVLFFELFVEVGTQYMAGDNAKRRAADTEYRLIAGRIRAHRGQ